MGGKKEPLIFITYIVAAFLISSIPIVYWPFAWLETFFHEISHGLVALLTGGEVQRIVLYWNGSGLCYYTGGWRIAVAFAGYLGAVLWGAAIYLSARIAGPASRWLAAVMLMIILISGVLWARDLVTISILMIISGGLYLSYRSVSSHVFPRLIEFAGIFVLLSAMRSPLNLVDGRHYGDGATLTDITHLPEIFWVIIWWSIAFSMLFSLWKSHVGGVVHNHLSEK